LPRLRLRSVAKPAVDADHAVLLLDPRRARSGRQSSVHGDAAIENLLSWVDRRL
jgi:hypothetical protein